MRVAIEECKDSTLDVLDHRLKVCEKDLCNKRGEKVVKPSIHFLVELFLYQQTCY